MRVLLDAALSTEGVGRRLAAAGHDVGALDQEPDLDTLDDEDVLELAAKDGSILVTLNVGDYPAILREWAASGRRHTGVVLLHGLGHAEFDAIVDTLELRFAERPKQEEWLDRAVVAERATLTSR